MKVVAAVGELEREYADEMDFRIIPAAETALAAASNPADFKTKLALEGADPEAVDDDERVLGPFEIESDERF